MHQYWLTQCATNLAACPRDGKNMQEPTQYSSSFTNTNQKIEGKNYVKDVCDIKSLKIETHRKIITAEVNIIDYSGEFNTPT